MRLITCGGAFDDATGHYLSNVVVNAAEFYLTGRRSRTAAPAVASPLLSGGGPATPCRARGVRLR